MKNSILNFLFIVVLVLFAAGLGAVTEGMYALGTGLFVAFLLTGTFTWRLEIKWKKYNR